MTDYEFQVDGFMLYCTSKNLSRKTLASYEQSLKLFGVGARVKWPPKNYVCAIWLAAKGNIYIM